MSDGKSVAARFGEHWRQVIAEHRERLNASATPPLIYHYTDEAGLRGILSSGVLRFTDIESLNDPSEFSYVIQRGLAYVKPLLPQRIGDRTLGEIFEEKYRNVRGQADHFICSFSCTREDIGQWRAYADDGRGFVLAFDKQELEDAFMKGAVKPAERATFRVQYGHKKLVHEISKTLEPVKEILPSLRERELVGVVSDYLTALLNLAVAFKHPAYKSEREYRFLELAVKHALPVKYREQPYAVVGYREFRWSIEAPTALKKIIIGPAADRSIARKFVSDCLNAFKVPPVEIRTSQIPYRRTKNT